MATKAQAEEDAIEKKKLEEHRAKIEVYFQQFDLLFDRFSRLMFCFYLLINEILNNKKCLRLPACTIHLSASTFCVRLLEIAVL